MYTLVHGDALTVLREIESNTVNATIVDPPYGIDYQSNRRVASEKLEKIKNDKTPLLGWASELFRITKDTGCVACFCRWDVQNEFLLELEQGGWVVKSQVIWDKVIHGTGDLRGSFAPQHEVIWFAHKGGFSFPNGRPKTVIRVQRVDPARMTHPNEKPVELMEYLVVHLTAEGQLVLDFTMGSGVTGVASIKKKRSFYGIELDRVHFLSAKTRIENAAGRFVLTEEESSSGQLGLFA
jgi:DNA modification methylase